MLIHFSLLIQTFLEAEMKKWPVDGLSMIDTSYHVADKDFMPILW
jgi:hypothetical protein